MEKEFRNTFIGISLLYLLFGLGMVIWPESAKLVICYAAGAICVVYAAVKIFIGYRASQFDLVGGSAIAGVVLLLLGLLMIIKSSVISAVLTAVIGLAVTADSLVKLQIAMRLKKFGVPRWKGDMIFAAVLLALGLFLLFDPFAGARLMTIIVGCILIVNAAANIWLLLELDKACKGFERVEHTIDL